MADDRARRRTGLVAPSGLAVALLGFGLTRFVVAKTIGPETSIPFAVGVVPLVVGLLFTVYGVVLAVGDLPRAYVRTVVRWSLSPDSCPSPGPGGASSCGSSPPAP